jgi:hypothetical protein
MNLTPNQLKFLKRIGEYSCGVYYDDIVASWEHAKQRNQDVDDLFILNNLGLTIANSDNCEVLTFKGRMFLATNDTRR